MQIFSNKFKFSQIKHTKNEKINYSNTITKSTESLKTHLNLENQ